VVVVVVSGIWGLGVVTKERFEEGLEPDTRWYCPRVLSLKSVHKLVGAIKCI
jgi:hypothetical protein